MSIRGYLLLLRERWPILVVAVLLGAGAAGAAWNLTPRQYTATLVMYVSAQPTNPADTTYTLGLLSQQRVASYVQLIMSEDVAADVARRLRLPPGEVRSQISASTSPDTVLIEVQAEGPSPQEVAAVANAVGDVVPNMVDRLEQPLSGPGAPRVAVRTLQSAAVPTAPSSIGLKSALALGVLAGAVVGLGCMLARNALDTSIKSLQQLRAASGVPVLGVVQSDSGVPKRPLTVFEDTGSPRAEDFRKLRTNLHLTAPDDPGRLILVTSPGHGDGKTTTACNLAIATAAAGSRVLVVEADLRRPRVAELLGLDRTTGLTNVLVGEVPFESAVQSWSSGLLDVLTTGQLTSSPSELLGSQQMRDLLTALGEQYDVVLIDAPPLLPVADAAVLAPLTEGVVLVCRYGRTTSTHVTSAVEALDAVSAELLGTVLTMVPKRRRGVYDRHSTSTRLDEEFAAQVDPVFVWRRSYQSRVGGRHGLPGDAVMRNAVLPVSATTAEQRLRQGKGEREGVGHRGE